MHPSIPPGSNGEVHFDNLPPGDYRIVVRGRNALGDRNTIRRKVTVLPPGSNLCYVSLINQGVTVQRNSVLVEVTSNSRPLECTLDGGVPFACGRKPGPFRLVNLKQGDHRLKIVTLCPIRARVIYHFEIN